MRRRVRKNGLDDKKMRDKKMDDSRGRCPGTPHRHRFYFFVIPFFCHFPSAGVAWSRATSDSKICFFACSGATDLPYHFGTTPSKGWPPAADSAGPFRDDFW
jgi:hypothetical protein